MDRNDTAAAGAGSQTLTHVRELDAPAAAAFRAHTDPGMLRQWIAPRGSELRIRDFVARTGGLWNCTIAGPDRELQLFGAFHEVTEPSGSGGTARIVRTVESGDRPGHPHLEVLRFTDLAEGRSRLEILSIFASAEARGAAAATADAEGEMYDRLDGLLASLEPSSEPSSEHGGGAGLYGETSNHRPGEPLRKWDGVTASGDLALTIMGSNSGEAIVRLVNGDPLSSDDLIAFGRLNSLCVLKWFEPLVMLLGPKGPQIAPDDVELLRKHTKLFR